ncbi:hypothetical protein EVAR_42816_1 [Eumeta japonica]|uniref:Uncharacterized protein n=1 Tax=Eumeta variegata TaxID=151549 RepID=A0A4C1WJ48_EUMVA|nr:hypothetical protein EVAR_42816_1 [Eumeta japonica]
MVTLELERIKVGKLQYQNVKDEYVERLKVSFGEIKQYECLEFDELWKVTKSELADEAIWKVTKSVLADEAIWKVTKSVLADEAIWKVTKSVLVDEAKKVCGVIKRINIRKKDNEWWNFEVRKEVS